MSMIHKAFVFDYYSFSQQLKPVLEQSLEEHLTQPLIDFIQKNQSQLNNPYTGSELTIDWKRELDPNNIQELADFAITKYYNPDNYSGLDQYWIDIDNQIPQNIKTIFLGTPIKTAHAIFDPGMQGSYFQSNSQVTNSLILLNNYLVTVNPSPEHLQAFNSFKQILEQAKNHHFGLYVTF